MEDLTPIEERYHVPGAARACHTAVVGGYVVVGHVPADVIRRILKERPDIVGVSAPGMPGGAPGMDGPRQPYEIVSFDQAGNIRVVEKRGGS